ncbi:methyltransferase domain-containing protein [Pedobacter nototheniae]|uniref:methyltransferase domain-containing protein n=1 Tax=Pedobacter nototheniae TaxID=2488994 RepID=UPI00292D055D|nr:methyltransferase domain-containing protein [Pedobacter nototheniae]
MGWNPEVYNKFKEERYEPFYDLQALIEIKPGLKVIDLGCGTGELTHKLSQYLPACTILGIDSSAEMLQSAKEFANDQVQFELTSIQSKIEANSRYDLIFSNAALQWLNHHEILFPSIIKRLNPGGQLAVQIPSNHDHFTHLALTNLAATEPYFTALKGWARSVSVLKIDDYSKIFYENNSQKMVVFEKVYAHVLQDAAAVFNWTSGTALIRYLERLPEHLRDNFKADYKLKIEKEYPSSPVFYPFKRILMSGFF